MNVWPEVGQGPLSSLAGRSAFALASCTPWGVHLDSDLPVFSSHSLPRLLWGGVLWEPCRHEGKLNYILALDLNTFGERK